MRRTWLVATTSFFGGATLVLLVIGFYTVIGVAAAVDVGRPMNLAFDAVSTQQARQERWRAQWTEESDLERRLRSLDVAVHFTAAFFACGALGLCLARLRDRRIGRTELRVALEP